MYQAHKKLVLLQHLLLIKMNCLHPGGGGGGGNRRKTKARVQTKATTFNLWGGGSIIECINKHLGYKH